MLVCILHNLLFLFVQALCFCVVRRFYLLEEIEGGCSNTYSVEDIALQSIRGGDSGWAELWND